MHHRRKEILIQWQERKRSLRMIWGYRSIRWNHWQEYYFRYCKSTWPLTRAEEIMMNGKQGRLRRATLIPSIRPVKDENSLGQSVLPETISLSTDYPLNISNSSIKQNSPNFLPTVKRFKLLRLGAPDRNRTCTESPRPEPESGASACSATGAYTAFAVIINLKLPISENGRKAIFRRAYRPRCRARKRFSPYFHR